MKGEGGTLVLAFPGISRVKQARSRPARPALADEAAARARARALGQGAAPVRVLVGGSRVGTLY